MTSRSSDAGPAIGPMVFEAHGRRWAEGDLGSPSGPGVADVRATRHSDGRLEVVCRVTVLASGEVAFELPVHVPAALSGPGSVLIPALIHPTEPTAGGLRPRFDPRHGIWLRADRLPQVGVILATSTGVCRVWSSESSPRPLHGGLVYGVGIHPDADCGMRVTWRYPQRESGHLGGGTPAAIVGKGVVGVGEERFLRAESGAAIVMRLWVEVVPGRRLDEELGSLARRIWPSFARKAHQSGPAPTASTVGRRLEYLDRRHWDPVLGQYASPDGSGTAMAGFVEMSLGMAIAAARIRHLGFRSGSSGTLEQDLGAIDRWVGAGGPLMPVWKGGQAVGGRRAYDQPGLPTTTAPLVEASRIAVEARHLLGLVRQGVARDERAGRWHAAARATADWLLARCRDGVLPIVVEDAAEGAVLRPIGDASAFLVSLLGELAVGESDGSVRQRLADRAAEVHQAAVEPRIQARRFGGTTLDAASPDREAAVAVLDAALAMHELTADERYLRDARIAADALLAWIVAHPVGTFQPGTDAAERRISTIGASLVSPENQHLDPFPIGGSLVRYGLYAGDMVAVRAGQANLAWCLDGRWATQTPDGIRQSEQLLHTRWHYDPWATERGDIRLGIPWSDGSAREHGWPQAVPLLGLLDHGHVALDWPTGRVSALPGIRMTRARTAHGYVLRLPDAPVTGPGLLVRVLRPPGPLVVRMRGRAGPLPWPRSLAVIIVSGDWAAIEAPLGAAIPTTRKRLQSC